MTIQPHRDFAFPSLMLRPYVDRYWAWEGDRNHLLPLPRLFPGTGMELIFHYGTPFHYAFGNGVALQAPAAHIMCLRETSVVLQPATATGFISVALRTGGFGRFCVVPPALLMDGFTDARDLFGKAAETLGHQIAEAASFAARVALIEQFLIPQFASRGKDCDDAMFEAAQHLYYNYAGGRVDDAVSLAGVGIRQFQRRFLAEMGMGPKQFLRIARFHHAVRSLLLGHAMSLADAALGHGYYDQSHCIHDFRSFAAMRPSDVLAEGACMTHFYNTSRPAVDIFAP